MHRKSSHEVEERIYFSPPEPGDDSRHADSSFADEETGNYGRQQKQKRGRFEGQIRAERSRNLVRPRRRLWTQSHVSNGETTDAMSTAAVITCIYPFIWNLKSCN